MEEPLLYSPTKGRRRTRKGSDASLWSSRTFSAKSRSEQNLHDQTDILLKRRNTFVIDNVAQEDSILHNSKGGLKALLSKKGQDNFVFPPEVKAYINSHFRMIREENLRLSQSLEKSNNQLKELRQGAEHENDLKSLKAQLEREKAKNKAMLKRLKEDQHNDQVIWMSQKQQQESNNNENSSSRPSTSIISAKVDHQAADRKVKLLNKTVKNLRMEIAELQKQNYTMKQVLISEIGSESEVEHALASFSSKRGGNNQSWEGRASKIAKLEAQVKSLRNSESSRPGSPKHPVRGTGDGSSRQGSLTPTTPNNLPEASESLLSASFDRNLQIKYEEEATIRKVSEVERERLGEHVRVLTKRLRSAEDSVIASEVALRSERKQNAELQKLLEKAHIELRDNSSGNSKRPHSELAFFSNSKPSSTTGLATKNLREELKITQDQLETLGKQREEDLDMYLKLASDSRRMFTQGLKETLEK